MAKFSINETEEKIMLEYLISESFIPKPALVLRIKSYIDKAFKPQLLDDIDENGYPKKVYSVVMLSGNQPVKTLPLSEFLLLLDDKFRKMIKDDSDRKKFLKQVISDWLNNTISKEGLLSKNHL